MAKQTQTSGRAVTVRIVLSAALIAAAAYVLVRNWSTVQNSIDAARGASILWLACSLVLMSATFAVAAGIYGVLALHPLRYGQTVLVEVATAFVNKLLPAGIGGLGLHGVYLYRRRHTAAEATVVVSVNNLVGMAAHLLLLSAVLIGNPALVHEFTDGRNGPDWRVFLMLLAVIAAIFAVPAVRMHVTKFARNLMASIRKVRLAKVVRALLLAMVLTVTYTLILYTSAQSVDVQLSLLQIFIVFSIGMLAATATPTPGGLVGAEAGLFAGFVAYGVPVTAAGAAVLLYRLVSYWIPLLPGALALVLARRRKLV